MYSIFIASLLTGALLFSDWVIAQDGMDIITHSEVSQAALTTPKLRSIFGMRKQKWPDGTPIRVFVMADDAPEHLRFCIDNLKVYPYQLRRRWDRSVFSGSFHAPTQVSSAAEMRELVSRTPGAIGYLSHSASGDLNLQNPAVPHSGQRAPHNELPEVTP